MIDLNDVLLAMSNIPVDDPIAEIWGRQMQGGYKIIEYTGILPITINANGAPVLDYRIYGADGGVGELTENPYGYKLPMTVASKNLFDGEMESGYYDGNGEKQSSPNWIRCKDLVSVNPNTVYHAIIDNPERISGSVVFARCYDARGEYIGTTSQKVIRYYEEYEFTTLDNTAFISFYVSNSYNGMKIEIYQGRNTAQTVPVYIGENQLGEDEYVSYSDGKIYRIVDGTLIPTDPPVPLPEIPTIDGTAIIDYDGDPKPSQMYVKYKG